jgi:hypothetical protein
LQGCPAQSCRQARPWRAQREKIGRKRTSCWTPVALHVCKPYSPFVPHRVATYVDLLGFNSNKTLSR